MTDDNEEIQNLISVNELKFESESSFISEVEWSQFTLSDKPTWSTYPAKPICQIHWENALKIDLERVSEDNPYEKLEEGEISASQAISKLARVREKGH